MTRQLGQSSLPSLIEPTRGNVKISPHNGRTSQRNILGIYTLGRHGIIHRSKSRSSTQVTREVEITWKNIWSGAGAPASLRFLLGAGAPASLRFLLAGAPASLRFLLGAGTCFLKVPPRSCFLKVPPRSGSTCFLKVPPRSGSTCFLKVPPRSGSTCFLKVPPQFDLFASLISYSFANYQTYLVSTATC